MDRLAAMEVFRTVAERESFTHAARQLGISVGTASKYLSWLEAHLGAVLLARSTRRLSLTEAGRAYYSECVRLLDDIEALERSTAQRQTVARGLLKVRAPISLDYAGLGRMIGAFLRAYPAVKVEMTLNDRFVDLDDEGFDVALALGGNLRHAAHPTYATRAIARMTRMLVAAPSYLAVRGMPARPQDLKRHACLVYERGPAPEEWHFAGRHGQRMVHVDGGLRSNNSQILKDAVIEGCGVGLLPGFVVADAVEDGRLCRLLPEWTPHARTLYAVLPNPRNATPKINAFVDFIAEGFAADPRWQV